MGYEYLAVLPALSGIVMAILIQPKGNSRIIFAGIILVAIVGVAVGSHGFFEILLHFSAQFPDNRPEWLLAAIGIGLALMSLVIASMATLCVWEWRQRS